MVIVVARLWSGRPSARASEVRGTCLRSTWQVPQDAGLSVQRYTKQSGRPNPTVTGYMYYNYEVMRILESSLLAKDDIKELCTLAPVENKVDEMHIMQTTIQFIYD